MLKKTQNKETAKTGLVRRQRSPYLLIGITILIIIVIIGGFFLIKKRVDFVAYKNVTIGNRVYELEVADTEAAREQGLSERDNIPSNGGMFFDFKSDGDWRIWMLKMRFNIDIAWLDKSGKIVFIKDNAEPASYPEAYHPNAIARYVIEVPAGTFKAQSVKVGNYIDVGQ